MAEEPKQLNGRAMFSRGLPVQSFSVCFGCCCFSQRESKALSEFGPLGQVGFIRVWGFRGSGIHFTTTASTLESDMIRLFCWEPWSKGSGRRYQGSYKNLEEAREYWVMYHCIAL